MKYFDDRDIIVTLFTTSVFGFTFFLFNLESGNLIRCILWGMYVAVCCHIITILTRRLIDNKKGVGE